MNGMRGRYISSWRGPSVIGPYWVDLPLSSSDPLSTVQSIDGISFRLAFYALGPIYYTLIMVFWISSPTEIASGWPFDRVHPLKSYPPSMRESSAD